MTANEKIKALAEIVRGVIQGLHDAAPECYQCAMQGSDACAGYTDAIEVLNEITEG